MDPIFETSTTKPTAFNYGGTMITNFGDVAIFPPGNPWYPMPLDGKSYTWNTTTLTWVAL